MFKFLVILSLLIMTVLTQDMPPPDLDISTRRPLTTTEPTTLQPTTPEPTTTEEITTTTEAETTTTTTEALTTEAADTTPEPTTSTAVTTTTTTIRNDVPISPVTDSPFSTTTTTSAPKYPFYPSKPDYFGMRCYFKQQYGYPQWRWTCQGFKYVYPIECFQCCHLQHASFAGCVTVHAHHCNSLNHRHGYYK